MGLHTLTVSEVINTLALPNSFCTVAGSVIALVVCAIGTLPRKLEHVAIMGVVSASEWTSKTHARTGEKPIGASMWIAVAAW